MSAQQQLKASTAQRELDRELEAAPAQQDVGEKVDLAPTDELLDEIDELLAEVGENVAIEYRQRGGE